MVSEVTRQWRGQAPLVHDCGELRASGDGVKRKYGRDLPSSNDGEPLTLAEQATFELIPEEQA